MFLWTPKMIKELKEQGLKIKYYEYDPRLKDKTFEEIEAEDQEEIEGTQQ